MRSALRTRDQAVAVLLFLGISVSMAVAIRWYYLRQSAAVEEATARELKAIGEGKLNQIARWRRERMGDATVLAASPVIGAARRMLENARQQTTSLEELARVARALQNAFGYKDLMLADTDGQVFYRLAADVNPEADLKQAQRRSLVRAALQKNEAMLSGITQETRFSNSAMTLTVPIAPRGALILVIDPATWIFPVMAMWPGESRTGETMLVARENGLVIYLSPLRHQPLDAEPNSRSLPGQKPYTRELRKLTIPSDAVMAAGVIVRTRDYRGEEVIGYLRQVPDSNWFIIAKMDSSEVRQPIVELGREMSVLFAVILLAGASAAGWVWKAGELRRQRESEARFRAVADDTPALLWMLSAEEENLFINQSLARFLGVRGSHLTLPWTTFLHPDDAARAGRLFENCFARRVLYSDQIRLRRADGEYRWTTSQGVPRFSQRGEFVGFAGALLDISEVVEAQQRLTEANGSLEQSLAAVTKQEAEIRRLTARLMSAQEEERKRLSREIHDDLAQEIAAISIAVGLLRMGLRGAQLEAVAQSQAIQSRLVNLSDSVRRISHDLHPAILQHSGLDEAIQSYVAELERNRTLRVTVDTQGDFDDLAPAVSLNLYRIAQEALQNVARHAQCQMAEVQLRRDAESVTLRVSDRGVGLPATMRAEGLGIISIRERTHLMGGRLSVESAAGSGTTILVTVQTHARESAISVH